MHGFLSIFNAFIEDTCVIVAVAYLLTRSRLLGWLRDTPRTRRETLQIGVILAAVGLTEIVFPGARAPYVTDILIVAFATFTAGFSVGLVCAVLVTLAGFCLLPFISAIATALSLFASLLITRAFVSVTPIRFLNGFLTGILTQICALLITLMLHRHGQILPSLLHAIASVVANGFGLVLILLVLDDARVRARSEQNRVQAERAEALAARSQFIALRTRIHPHFLLNTLSAIAALCGIAPVQAEEATIQLGGLMRRILETDPESTLPISDDIEYARLYLGIEEKRFGTHLRIVWRIDPACFGAQVPQFALQTLLENAVHHGIEPKVAAGTVILAMRRYPRHVLLAVIDNGVGMSKTSAALKPAGEPRHGLPILTQQLQLLYGPRARVRLYSRIGDGTLAVFIVPVAVPQIGFPVKRWLNNAER